MKLFLKKENGAAIVIVALSMSLFIALLALVLDMGSLYLEKNRMQKIVDAAALAGAMELPDNYNKSLQEIKKAITLNNGDPSQYTTTTNQSFTKLEVIGRKKGTLYFGKALGIEEPNIQANARVELLPLISGKGAIPLGIQPSTSLSFGTVHTLKVSDSASGNFGAIALTGPGAKDYETDLRLGYAFNLSMNSILNTQTGQLAGPTKRAVDARIALCPNATYIDYPTNCERVALIPVFEPVQTDQNQIKQVKVVGFATFFLEGVTSTSTGAEVTGRFIRMAYSGETGDQTQSNYGTYGYKLTQ